MGIARNFRNISKLKKIILILATVLTIIIVLLPAGYRDIDMDIYYNNYPSAANVTQVCWDTGGGFSVDEVSTQVIAPVTRIAVDKSYAGRLKNIRIDFVDSQGIVSINKIVIKRNGLVLRTYTAQELKSIFFPLNGIEELKDETDNYVVKCTSIDGYVGSDPEFVRQFDSLFLKQPIEYAVYASVGVVILMLLVCSIFLPIKDYCTKLDDYLEKIKKTKKICIVSGIFVLGVLFCYRNYIIGNAVFIFQDIGCDSINQTFPNLYHYADLISNGEQIFGFDFAEGLGAVKQFDFVNIFDWPILFGTKALPYFLGISQIIKVILSYIIMYFYLKVMKRRELTSHIGAMSYALCGYMMVRQYWKSYPNIVVLSALVLLCMELAITKKRYKWLPIALSIYCVSCNSYSTCLMFAMVVGYTVFRYFQINDVYRMKTLGRLIVRIISAYMIAVLVSGLVVLPSLAESLGGNRFKEGTKEIKSQMLSSIDLDIVKTAFFRTVSNDWGGFDQHFTGWGNIATAPGFYCGILLLALVPMAVLRQKKAKRISSVAAITFSLAYVCLPGLNYAMNGFSEVGFRLSSIWVFFVIIYLGTLGMDIWIEERSQKQVVVLVTLSVIIFMVTLLSAGTKYFDIKIYIRTMGILLLFALLVFIADKVNRNIFYVLIILLVSFDLFSNAYIFCDTPIKVTEDRLNAYKSETVDQINEMDDTIFYRIEKAPEVFYCDSLYQNYYGTNQYSGHINDGLHQFYEKLHIPMDYESSKHVLSGLNNSNSLYSLLGIKYIISESVIDNNYGVDVLEGIDGTYFNNKVLPIGFCYDNIIYNEEFEALDVSEKRKAILDGCVLQKSGLNVNVKEAQDYKERLNGDKVSYVYNEENKMISFDTIDENCVVVFDFITEGAKKEAYCEVSYGNDETKVGSTYISVTNKNKDQHLELCGSPISYIKMNSFLITDIKDINIKVYDKDMYYKNLDNYIENRRAHSFNCETFIKNRIEGSVSNDKDSILFFSIPYDKGWSIYVDGVKSELMKVNYGFIGTYLPAGDHDVILQYRMPYINISIVITIVGMIAIVAWFIYWRRKEKGDNVRGENIGCSTSI